MTPALVARVMLIVVLAVAMWNPTVPIGRDPLAVVVLVDDSISVDAASQRRAWRAFTEDAQRLPRGTTVTVIRFAADAVVELDDVTAPTLRHASSADEVPRTHELDRTRTNVERALDLALTRVATGHRPAAVVLMTDGAETDGNAVGMLDGLRAAAAPVLLVTLTRAAIAGDFAVESVEAPAHARIGDVVPVVVAVGGTAPRGADLRLQLDGEVVATQHLEPTSGTTRVELGVRLRGAGTRQLTARVLAADDPIAENDTRAAFVTVDGPPRVLYASAAMHPGMPPLAASLRLAGFDVAEVDPSALERELAAAPPAAVVLDDVAIDDAPSPVWPRLAERVRVDGTGLLVLGGPRSFANGGYRGSALEDVLPVTAEARRPRSRAAILFLIDTSGSMERDARGRDRLALARAAITETTRVVDAGDLLGITSFAVAPRDILPLASRPLPFDAGAVVLPAPSGGTLLAPALAHAIDALTRVRADERLLVVVTDGFTEGEDLDAQAAAAVAGHIDVVALAVGSDVDVTTLGRLVGTPRGGLLRVDDVAALPRLMRQAVAVRRASIERGTFRPRSDAPLPFALDVAAWPELTGYAAVRPRPASIVQLVEDRGDPLMISGVSGAGRVIVLPGGLAEWADVWPRWEGWGSFVAGVSQWIARRSDSPRLDTRFRETPQGIAFTIDALGADGEWSTAATAHLTITDPSDETRGLDVPATAPGRFAGVLPSVLPGAYRVSVGVDDESRVDHVIRTAGSDVASTSAPTSVGSWTRAGLVNVGDAGVAPDAPPRRVPLRPWLTGAVLAVYLLILWREESFAARARASRSRPRALQDARRSA